jgi:hypothetical protein
VPIARMRPQQRFIVSGCYTVYSVCFSSDLFAK